MIAKVLQGLQILLDIPYVRRVRRNHGLEHATIHLLSQQLAELRAVGHSDAGGFYLFGSIPTESVHQCVTRALERMRQGEHQLALHPNCGTNLMTVASLGAVAALFALVGSERGRFGKLQRLPLIVLVLLLALVAGQPLGMLLQRHITTLGDPADLEILDIQRIQRGSLLIHRIKTHSS